jgi:MFS transporter, DHA2 family, multidrug resistance protein
MAAFAAAPTSSEVAHGSTLFTVSHNTAASVGAALMSVLLGSRLNRSDVEHVASDLSHAYAAGVLVAMIMIAATAIPASFLSRRPTARMA